MAEITVKNAKVVRIIDGYGFVCATETQLKSGDMKEEKYTVWTDTKAQVGDVVNVKGLLGVKVEEFQGRTGDTVRYAAVHVNNAQVESDAPF